MFDEFRQRLQKILPTKYWEEINRKSLRQLASSHHIKYNCAVACNFFTWIVNFINKQFRFLMRKAVIDARVTSPEY